MNAWRRSVSSTKSLENQKVSIIGAKNPSAPLGSSFPFLASPPLPPSLPSLFPPRLRPSVNKCKWSAPWIAATSHRPSHALKKKKKVKRRRSESAQRMKLDDGATADHL